MSKTQKRYEMVLEKHINKAQGIVKAVEKQTLQRQFVLWGRGSKIYAHGRASFLQIFSILAYTKKIYNMRGRIY